jgi:SWI/SNF-related matrix-associated actin-dependent regulator of chromatin subfamily A member 5
VRAPPFSLPPTPQGLGKTLQTISLLGYLAEHRAITGPHIVIVPKSTLGNWCNEFKRWCPSLRVVKFHGNAEERAAQKARLEPGAFDVCATTYEMVIKEKGHLKRFRWRYIIIDEAHRMKNENSVLAKVLRSFNCNNRLLITGTPLQNNLHELWALLNFLLPEVFADAAKFDEWFGLAGDAGEGKQKEVVAQLHKVLRPFLLRRLKADVEKGLPPKKETILKVGLSDMQRHYYKSLIQKDIEAIQGGGGDRSRLLNIVMQLRKCCNHPYLFAGAEPGPPYFMGEHLVENAGKMILLDKLLPRLQARGSRVLVFSQMTRMLDVLEDYMHWRGYQYCRIDGNTQGDEREASIEAFNAPHSEKFVFLLSTRAGGLGINLATADTVVLYDSDWNPQMDLQAMDRAHRIGQTKEVQVFRFMTEDSVEVKVIEKAYKKLALDALVIQQGRLQDAKAAVGKDDLLQMVRYGAEKIFSGASGNITAEDIDTILQKGEADTQALSAKMNTFKDAAMKFSMEGDKTLYDFEGEAPPLLGEEGGEALDMRRLAAANWVEPPKREKKMRSYNENEYFRERMQQQARAPRPAGPKLASLPKLHDFQFFNAARISEIQDKEEARARWVWGREAAAKEAGVELSALEEDADEPPEISEAEAEERAQLLTQGFGAWQKRDFLAFTKAMEKYGRDDFEAIARDMAEMKSEEEVRTYAAHFWAHVGELADGERITRNIEKGEQKIQRQKDIIRAISKKLELYKNPARELKIAYGTNKGKAYTEEEDRFLLCAIPKVGYGAWDELKAEIRKHWLFRFDWFFKSRTPAELGRRVETLVRLVEKEAEEAEAEEAKKAGRPPPPKKASAAGGDEGGPSGAKRKADGAGGAGKKQKAARV